MSVLRIYQNPIALNSLRNLQITGSSISKSLERLSSGLRINRAADDAAGLAISESLKSDIRALDVAVRNAGDGISLVQTAEGALDEVSSMLIRMRELATQARNGTVTAQQRTYLDAEFQTLAEEITRIGQSTDFNGVQLLDGSSGTLNIQVGIGTTVTDGIGVDLSTSFTAAGLGLAGVNIADDPDTAATDPLTALADALDRLNAGRASLGAIQNRLESSIRVNMNLSENLTAANSRIRDVDVASETSRMTSYQILQQAGISILSQANMTPALAMNLLGG